MATPNIPRSMFIGVKINDWELKDDFERILGLVQEEERVRIRKFRFDIDKKRALCGRLLIKYMLCHGLQVPFSEIKLKRNKNTKPILDCDDDDEAKQDLSFNISHHGNWVLGVCHPTRLVGVDVVTNELPRAGHKGVADYVQMMQKSGFTAAEKALSNRFLETHPEEDSLRLFFRHWAMKETYVKAIGRGLPFGTKRVEVVLPPGKELTTDRCQVRVDEELLTDWEFRFLELDELHSGAVGFGFPKAGSSTDLPEFSEVEIDKVLSVLFARVEEAPASEE